MMRAALVALFATLVLAATGCGGSSSTTSSATQRKLTDLHSVSQLQAAFNTASGEPRLVVLVSPT
jgi:hypothetical protein